MGLLSSVITATITAASPAKEAPKVPDPTGPQLRTEHALRMKQSVVTEILH